MTRKYPPVELLEETHSFPGFFTFKVIGVYSDGFASTVVNAVREELEMDFDPPFRTRSTPGGRHIAVTLEPVMETAREVIQVYERLSKLPGLIYLF